MKTIKCVMSDSLQSEKNLFLRLPEILMNFSFHVALVIRNKSIKIFKHHKYFQDEFSVKI